MQNKKIRGKWQKQVYKVLVKRGLQDAANRKRDAAAKTAAQQEDPENSIKQR